MTDLDWNLLKKKNNNNNNICIRKYGKVDGNVDDDLVILYVISLLNNSTYYLRKNVGMWSGLSEENKMSLTTIKESSFDACHCWMAVKRCWGTETEGPPRDPPNNHRYVWSVSQSIVLIGMLQIVDVSHWNKKNPSKIANVIK